MGSEDLVRFCDQCGVVFMILLEFFACCDKSLLEYRSHGSSKNHHMVWPMTYSGDPESLDPPSVAGDHVMDLSRKPGKMETGSIPVVEVILTLRPQPAQS